jgi:hypothetical protein
MRETLDAHIAQRTGWNVRDSDGTLVIVDGPPTAGTALTIDLTVVFQKPCRVVDIAEMSGQAPGRSVEAIAAWLGEHDIRVLNVAGPRESEAPGIYQKAEALLLRILS